MSNENEMLPTPLISVRPKAIKELSKKSRAQIPEGGNL